MPSKPHPAKAVLTARGLSIKDAARQAEVSHHWLGRVLNGHEEPSADLRRRLAALLELDERELFHHDVADLLRRTRTERGMALIIDDPAIIAKLAAIVAAGGGGASDAA